MTLQNCHAFYSHSSFTLDLNEITSSNPIYTFETIVFLSLRRAFGHWSCGMCSQCKSAMNMGTIKCSMLPSLPQVPHSTLGLHQLLKGKQKQKEHILCLKSEEEKLHQFLGKLLYYPWTLTFQRL